jgi:hypothetical protein
LKVAVFALVRSKAQSQQENPSPKYSKPQGVVGPSNVGIWKPQLDILAHMDDHSKGCKIKHMFWVDPMFIQDFKTPPVYYYHYY